jgi:hypothetical protein
MANKKMSEEEILTALDANISSGVGYFDTKLSKERETVLKYYHGDLPQPNHAGNSKYVSLDVYDTVESAKAQILEVFSAGSSIVEFAPDGAADVALCKQATAYTEHVVFEQNDGFGIFSDVLQDSLLARVGVVKVYWDEISEDEEEEFSNQEEGDIVVMLSDPDITIQEINLDSETGLVSGSFTRKVDKSQVRIEPIAPEEFVISSRAITIPEALFCAHRTQKTQGELIAEGFDAKLVKSLQTDATYQWDTEKLARLNNIAADHTVSDVEYAETARPITVFESYIRLDIDGTGAPRLWKIVKADKTILDKQKVDCAPFIGYAPLPLPHSFFGQNYAKLVIPIQNARSVLMRGILDHTVRTNNPRTMVVKGALVNPREMLDNRIGGLVNVTRPDGLIPEPQAPLNPFVFQTIQLLDEDKEDATGVSKLSQGLNKDAVSKQNAQGLIDNLVSLSQIRQKIIARNFANKFLVPLYLEVYRLVIEHEKKEKIVKVAGSFTPCQPSDWKARSNAKVTLKLGYGEQEKDAQEILQLHMLFAQDPSLQPMYDLPRRHNMMTKYLDKKGCKDVDSYLMQPEQVPPPEPPPDFKLKMRELDLKERDIVLREGQARTSAQMDMLDHQLERMKTMMDVMAGSREQERKDFESKKKYEIAEQELAIIESQPATETKQSNIVSPNS